MDIQQIIADKKARITELNETVTKLSFQIKVMESEVKKLTKLLDQANEVLNAKSEA